MVKSNDEDRIEQKVILSDQAQITGDVTLIGKVFNTIRQPAQWQDTLFTFLSAHRYLLLVLALLQLLLFTLFLVYKDLYMIPWWAWAIAAFCLLLAVWSGYTYGRFTPSPIRLTLTVLGLIAFSSLMGWQSWRVTHPPSFPSQSFGIAIAGFKNNAWPTFSNLSDEIAAQVYERLCIDANQFFSNTSDANPCQITPETAPKAPLAIQRIGIIPDSQTARDFGQTIGADIVIWGQLISQKSGGATVHFEVLSTLNQAINPDFPIVMPIKVSSAEIFSTASQQDIGDDPIVMKEIIAEQSVILSSFVLGLAAYLEQNFPEAIRQLELTVTAVKNSEHLQISNDSWSVLYYYLGTANQRIGRIQIGQEWLQKAEALESGEPAIPLSLALGYNSLGEVDGRDRQLQAARQLLNSWLQTHPNDASALYNRGIIHQVQKESTRAILDYEAALNSDETFYIAYLQLSIVYRTRGQLAEAQESLETAVTQANALGLKAASAYLYLGDLFEQQNKLPEVRAAYQQAIQLGPNVARNYFQYALFLENQGEMDAALHHLQIMVEKGYQKGWAYEQLGHFYFRRQLYDDALLAFETAVNYESNAPLLHTYLADVHVALGDIPAALAASEQAVALNETAAIYFVYAKFGKLLFELGEYDQATEYYEKSLALRPIDYPVLLTLGVAQEILGNTTYAAELYQRIIDFGDHFEDEQVQIAVERLQALQQTAP